MHLDYTLYLALFTTVIPTISLAADGRSLTTRSLPLQSDWSQLNGSVSGHLQIGIPFSRPCFEHTVTPVYGSENISECANIASGYRTDTFRVQFLGAYMNTQWETCQATGERCELDSNDPNDDFAFMPPAMCSQSSIPNLFVEVETPEEVSAVFAFVKTFAIKLVIKNTGHDYIGRSSGPDTLAISTRKLQNISYNSKFIPDQCPPSSSGPAVTFGAGVVHQTLYQFADSMNITLPGAEDATVGAAGGYLQGGGHSAVANVVGLAVDRVLEFKIVTPEGDYLTANACQNSDLFWALRGGGGGTFGVVMEVTMKALPKMPLVVMAVVFDGLVGSEVSRLLSFMASHAVQYAKAGWGGYTIPAGGLTYVNPLLSLEEAAQETADLKTLAEQLNGTFSLTVEDSFLAFYNKFLLPPPIPVGLPFTFVSRLIPATNFETETTQQELVNAMVSLIDISQITVVAAVTPFSFESQNDTSVTPAWRNSIWHVLVGSIWNYNATEQVRKEIYQNGTTLMDTLRAITLGSGAYMNEADVYEPNFADAFWGANYEELVRIKQKYDPEHLLDCWHCVEWNGAQDPRYACYLSDIRSS